MSIDGSLDLLRRTAKDTYMLTHKSKTDDELRQITLYNARNIIYRNEIDAAKMLGETDACNALLQERAEQRSHMQAEDKAIQTAKSAWPAQQASRVMDAILNLKASISYPGQLVMTILGETGGLTGEALRQASNVLCSMADEEYEQLLSGLISEGVVAEYAPYYSLKTTFDENLLVGNVVSWANELFNRNGDSVFTYKEEDFLSLPWVKTHPFTEYDWLEKTGSTYELEQAHNARAFSSIDRYRLETLCRVGVLRRHRIEGTKCHLYYLRLIGEEIQHEV